MKKAITIFILLALLLQAAPVLRFAADDAVAFSGSVGEEPPAEEWKESKSDRCDDKFSPHPVFSSVLQAPFSNSYNLRSSQLPPIPYLQQHTPPPNAC